MKQVNEKPTQEMIDAALPIFGDVQEMTKQEVRTLSMDLEYVWRTMYAAAPDLELASILSRKP